MIFSNKTRQLQNFSRRVGWLTVASRSPATTWKLFNLKNKEAISLKDNKNNIPNYNI